VTAEPVLAVLLDYGGVVRREDPADWDEVAGGFGIAPGAAWSAFHDAPEYAASRTGRLDAASFRAAVVRRLAAAAGDEARADRCLAGIEAAAGAFPAVEPEVAALLARLRGRVRLGLLTNAAKGAGARLRARGVSSLFDDVVASGDVGVAKPDPEAFLLAARRLGVAPRACAVVDDLERNVAGARAAGMRAHLHHRTRHDDLLRFLEREGALPPRAEPPA
jgi:HAD superfamily hydrolase (TIGR01509 family)